MREEYNIEGFPMREEHSFEGVSLGEKFYNALGELKIYSRKN